MEKTDLGREGAAEVVLGVGAARVLAELPLEGVHKVLAKALYNVGGENWRLWCLLDPWTQYDLARAWKRWALNHA